jgi:hypothetical protein
MPIVRMATSVYNPVVAPVVNKTVPQPVPVAPVAPVVAPVVNKTVPQPVPVAPVVVPVVNKTVPQPVPVVAPVVNKIVPQPVPVPVTPAANKAAPASSAALVTDGPGKSNAVHGNSKK